MTRRRLLHCVIIIVLLFSAPRAASARSIKATLTGLTVSADLIVVARVEKISTGADRLRVAEARVLEVWKGTPVSGVSFRASKAWVCDISDAIENETVVLFLVAKKETPVLSIAYWGQGRLPVSGGDRTPRVTLEMQKDCFRLKEASNTPGSRLESQPRIGELDLPSLKSRVERIIKENRQACTPREWIA